MVPFSDPIDYGLMLLQRSAYINMRLARYLSKQFDMTHARRFPNGARQDFKAKKRFNKCPQTVTCGDLFRHELVTLFTASPGPVNETCGA